jgi:hypothetical protein
LLEEDEISLGRLLYVWRNRISEPQGMYTTNEKQFPEFNFIKQDYGEPQYKKEEGRILDRETKKKQKQKQNCHMLQLSSSYATIW